MKTNVFKLKWCSYSRCKDFSGKMHRLSGLDLTTLNGETRRKALAYPAQVMPQVTHAQATAIRWRLLWLRHLETIICFRRNKTAKDFSLRKVTFLRVTNTDVKYCRLKFQMKYNSRPWLATKQVHPVSSLKTYCRNFCSRILHFTNWWCTPWLIFFAKCFFSRPAKRRSKKSWTR